MSRISPDSRPTLNGRFRLQWEQAQQAHVLLYPEGMVKLNDSAAAILQYCNGQHRVAEICADLAQRFGATDVTDDVVQFLDHARERGWLTL